MRLVLICHLLALLLVTYAKASENEEAERSPDNEPEIKEQVSNYRVARKKPKSHLYKSVHIAKFKNYEITEIPHYDIPPLLSREDMNKIIPQGVSATDPANEVLKKMGDKAVNVMLKSPTMQNMKVVQAAQTVENAMKAEVALAPADSSEVQHKLKFQVQAFQTTSKVDYTGYVDATVSYNMRDHATGYEVRRKVMRNKDLYVNHTKSKDDDLSSVGLKWNF